MPIKLIGKLGNKHSAEATAIAAQCGGLYILIE